MENWKGKFDNEFTIIGQWGEKRFTLARLTNYSRTEPIVLDDQVITDLKQFIETEIIERLINDAAGRLINDYGMRKELRAKWLGK